MFERNIFLAVLLCAATPWTAGAQSPTDMAALRGLAPVSVLRHTAEGKAALRANLVVTENMETGSARQPTLLPFAEQQQQALRDAFLTGSNAAQLADGWGTTLGAAYLARAHALNRQQGTDLTASVKALIAYANATSETNSGAGKYFFANGTTNGTQAASAEALAVLTQADGEADVFGKAYNLPAGAPGADLYGNSRPFMTLSGVTLISGPDYFNAAATNLMYNRGPLSNLENSPSFPSGHTTYGYMESMLLALLVPERYQEMVTRAAEYGNDRILTGAHYAMDVLGGRTLALYDLAHLLANDPAYVGRSPRGVASIADFRAALSQAREDARKALAAGCGEAVAACAAEDIGRFHQTAANAAFYDSTQTYGLPVVYAQNAAPEDVGKLAPEAGYLLTGAFPGLTLAAANQILTETEGPGGGFLDNGSGFGVYSRLNLYAAAGKAAGRQP